MPRNGLKFFLSGRKIWDQAFWGVVGGPATVHREDRDAAPVQHAIDVI
jgi:hypothetical protein